MSLENLNYIPGFLVIEGNIGAGKTTLAQMVADKYNAQPVFEQFAENPFLAGFYQNPKQYAYVLEMSFMAERYSQMRKELQNRDLFKSFVVSDYYFMKSLIFAGVTLSNDEYNLYRKFFDIVYDRLPKPDLYIYLHKSTTLLRQNIQKRGRSYEKSIDENYLKKISDAYFLYFKQQTEFPVLLIDTNHVDFLNNGRDFEKLCELIFMQRYPVGTTSVVI
jgi:deoxyguanosine kinase